MMQSIAYRSVKKYAFLTILEAENFSGSNRVSCWMFSGNKQFFRDRKKMMERREKEDRELESGYESSKE